MISGVVSPPGDHEYVPPGIEGVAVSVAFSPAHIVDELTVTDGPAFTITLICALGLSQPPTVCDT